MSKPKKSVSPPSKKAKSSKKTSSRSTSAFSTSKKKKPISSTKPTKKASNKRPKKTSPASKKTAKRKAKPQVRTNRLVLVTVITFLMGSGLGYMLYRYGPELLPVIEQIVNNEKTNQLAMVSHATEVQQIKRQNALDEVEVSGFSDNELRQCFYSADIDDTILTRLQNMGYTNQIPTSSLKYVRVLYYDYENRPTIGELVVNAEMAKPVENVFFDLFLHKYQIARMILPDAYGTRISESYADNNTVALCFGLTEDNRGSVQAQGYGIDLNPLQNPLIKDNGSSFSVFPMEGQFYLDRSVNSPHFIYQDDYAVKAFEKEGFVWTGNIEGINNYKHFEYSKADLPALPQPIKHDEDSENGEKKNENENSQSEGSPDSQEQGSEGHEDHSATPLEPEEVQDPDLEENHDSQDSWESSQEESSFEESFEEESFEEGEAVEQ